MSEGNKIPHEQLFPGIHFSGVWNNAESVLFAFLHALGKHDVPLPVSCSICGNLSYQKKPKVY